MATVPESSAPEVLESAPQVSSSLAPSPQLRPSLPVIDASQGLPHFELFDIEHKSVVKVPREQAADLLRSGLYAPKRGTYKVLDDIGDSYTVDDTALIETLQHPGTRFETADEQRRRESKAKYGHQSLRTFGESMADSATLGISTQLATKVYGVPAEDIVGRREENEGWSALGTGAGIVAPALATGGTSTLAQGVRGVGFGASGAIKAGLAVEKTLAKAFIAEGASPTLAAKISSKLAAATAGSMVEGALLSTGTLLSENALGRADINAENFLATVGPGALIGGAAGAALKGVELAANPILKFTSKQISSLADDFVDKNSAAMDLLGVSGAKATKLKSLRPELHDGASDYLKNELKLGPRTTTSELAERNSQLLNESGQKIGRIVDEVDATLAEHTLLKASDKAYFWNDAGKRLRQFFGDIPEGVGMKGQRDSVLRLIEEADTLAATGGILKASDVHAQRIGIDELIQWGKQAAEAPVKQQALRELRHFYSETLENLADKAGIASGNVALSADLKAANRTYSFAKTFDGPLNMKAGKPMNLMDFRSVLGGSILGSLDMGLGAAYAVGREVLKSDLKHKAVVLLSLEKAAQTVNKVVSSAVKNFSKGVRTLELPTRVLIQDHVLSRDLENRKASDKQAAMRNMQTNLLTLSENQEQLAHRVNRATSAFYKAAPQTSVAMDAYGISAVNFLTSKLPRKGTNGGVFAPFKKPRFSDMEIHKFQKYLEAIESPLKVIKKLEHGQINREHIEALKSVYPQLYEKLQTSLMDAVAEKPDSFTYSQKVQLAILLDAPTDASLQPEHIAGLQANFAPQAPEEQSGKGAVKTSQGGLSELGFSSRYATDSQESSTLDEA